jgi:hypothetical protein
MVAGEVSVQSISGGNSGGTRFFKGREASEVLLFAVRRNVSGPLVSRRVPGHPLHSRLVAARKACVPQVLRSGGFPQIAPPIVKAVPVNMVDVRLRPSSGHIKPRQTGGFISVSMDADVSVSPDGPWIDISSHHPRHGAVRIRFNLPSEDAGLGVVAKGREQFGVGNLSGFRHGASAALPVMGLARQSARIADFQPLNLAAPKRTFATGRAGVKREEYAP